MATCKVVTKEELIGKYGETLESLEELDTLARSLDSGETIHGKVTRIGRPPLSDDETKILAFRIPARKADAFDRKVKENGETRSQAFRELVDAYIEA